MKQFFIDDGKAHSLSKFPRYETVVGHWDIKGELILHYFTDSKRQRKTISMFVEALKGQLDSDMFFTMSLSSYNKHTSKSYNRQDLPCFNKGD